MNAGWRNKKVVMVVIKIKQHYMAVVIMSTHYVGTPSKLCIKMIFYYDMQIS